MAGVRLKLVFLLTMLILLNMGIASSFFEDRIYPTTIIMYQPINLSNLTAGTGSANISLANYWNTSNFTSANITNWNYAYNWVLNWVFSCPGCWNTSNFTQTDINHWNLAYSWGNGIKNDTDANLKKFYSEFKETGNTLMTFDVAQDYTKSDDALLSCSGTITSCTELTAQFYPCYYFPGCGFGSCGGDLNCGSYATQGECAYGVSIGVCIWGGGTSDSCVDSPALDCSMMGESTCLSYSAGCTAQYIGGSCDDNPSLDCSTMNEGQCITYAAGCTSNYAFSYCYDNNYCDNWDNQLQADCEAITNCQMPGGDYTDCQPDVACGSQSEGDCTSTYADICDPFYAFSSCSTSGSCGSFGYGSCPSSFGCSSTPPTFDSCSTSGSCGSFTYAGCPMSYGCNQQGSSPDYCQNQVADCSSLDFSYCETINDCAWSNSSGTCSGTPTNYDCAQITDTQYCTAELTNSHCTEGVDDRPTHIAQAGTGQVSDVYQCLNAADTLGWRVDADCSMMTVNEVRTERVDLSDLAPVYIQPGSAWTGNVGGMDLYTTGTLQLTQGGALRNYMGGQSFNWIVPGNLMWGGFSIFNYQNNLSTGMAIGKGKGSTSDYSVLFSGSLFTSTGGNFSGSKPRWFVGGMGCSATNCFPEKNFYDYFWSDWVHMNNTLTVGNTTKTRLLNVTHNASLEGITLARQLNVTSTLNVMFGANFTNILTKNINVTQGFSVMSNANFTQSVVINKNLTAVAINTGTLNTSTVKMANLSIGVCGIEPRMAVNNTGLYFCNRTDWKLVMT